METKKGLQCLARDKGLLSKAGHTARLIPGVFVVRGDHCTNNLIDFNNIQSDWP